MAESIHLFLKANGADIKGESSQTSLGREGSIECFEFHNQVEVVSNTSGRISTRRRQYQPIQIRKRIDKSSPLLMKLMCTNAVVEGELRFFRPNPQGDGTTEHYYSIGFSQARITAIHVYQADIFAPPNNTSTPIEEVLFTFNKISWIYNNGGVTYEDSTGGRV